MKVKNKSFNFILMSFCLFCSQFYMLLEQNVLANFTLNYQKATFFAPTNEAFQKFKGPLDEKIILYHIGENHTLIFLMVLLIYIRCLFFSAASGVAQPLDKLSDTVTTTFDGSPPLWVTRVQKAGSTKKEVFVNNARIHEKRSNFQGVNAQNSPQVRST